MPWVIWSLLINFNYLSSHSTGETLQGLKTEIEDDLEKSILVQEERIRNNSHLINTVKDGVENTLEDVRDYEAKLEDQEKRTTALVNRVSFNLGGLVSLAVEKVVKNNEEEVVRQRAQIADGWDHTIMQKAIWLLTK